MSEIQETKKPIRRKPLAPVLTVLNDPLTEQEFITLQHILRVLNHSEILDVLQINKVKAPTGKRNELDSYLKEMFKQSRLPKEIFTSLRERAFNPELNVTDGFYLSYSIKKSISDEKKINEIITGFNKKTIEGDYSYIAEMELLGFKNEVGKFLITRKHDKYAYDAKSMFSTKYLDEQKLLIEINFEKKIVYFQTSNIVKFRAIRTVVQDFLNYTFELRTIKLAPPRMVKSLTLTLSKDKKTVQIHDNLNPNTIKLLDLFLELNNQSSKFSSFECIEIEFDHEDKTKKNIKSRINTQAFGGGDLLGKDVVKNLVLGGRIIHDIQFKIGYDEALQGGQIKKHTILAGINSNSESLRIFIHNNNKDLLEVLKRAYVDLKDVLLAHFTTNELRNEEQIKKLLGID